MSRFNFSIWLVVLFAMTAMFIVGCEKSDQSITAPSALQSTPFALNSTSGPKPDMSTLTITCFSSTSSSITLAIGSPVGGTGALAGFSVQWMTAAQYAKGPDGSSGTQDDNSFGSTSDTLIMCKASFSGNANGSLRRILAGNSTTVEIGNLDDEEPGVSFTCEGGLKCGTLYYFRAFAHANSTFNRSEFSSVSCVTASCFGGQDNGYCGDPCFVKSQGFWKNHGPNPDLNNGNNSNQWPASVVANGLTIGTVPYSAFELQAILNGKAPGNGLLALAHQVIAVELSIANGACADDIAADLAAAHTMIGNLIIPPMLGYGFLDPAVTSALTSSLDGWIHLNEFVCAHPPQTND